MARRKDYDDEELIRLVARRIGLRARQDLMDRFLAPGDDRVENEVPPAERDFAREMGDLPEPLKTEVIRALGGPAATGYDL
ncbi:MAG: hypothetical protein ISS78_09660 [Phycisphaerae bacterium]|nr:hypothetical protein [Phycisphaerae bacterium]